MSNNHGGIHPELPQPPEVEKRLRFTRAQMVGMPILLLISLLALLGIFDKASTQEILASDQLRVTVEYPTQFSYNQTEQIEIRVHNLSAHTIPSVTVRVDAAYLRAFSKIQFTPSVDEVSEEWFQVHLPEVNPEESRQVVVEYHSQSFWRREGMIRIEPEGSTALETRISTFIFP
jgi:hypothetical protein